MGDKSPKSKQKADKQKKQQRTNPVDIPEPPLSGKNDKASSSK